MKIGGVHTTLDPFKIFFFFFNYHFKNTEFGKSFGYCITWYSSLKILILTLFTRVIIIN